MLHGSGMELLCTDAAPVSVPFSSVRAECSLTAVRQHALSYSTTHAS
jgi:hypothetical protein